MDAIMGQTNDMSAAKAGAAGYSGAKKSLQQSLKLAGTDATAQMGAAQQQLQQNQGKVQQGLINSGLGNTTVAQTMQQAPLATYNSAVSQIQDNLTGQRMQGLNNLAQEQSQGGFQLSGLLAALQNQNKQNQLAQTEQVNKFKTPQVTYNGV